MPQLPWKDSYRIDYKEVDDQHQELLGLMNDLGDLVESGRSPELVRQIFHQLFVATQVHFATEERYLLKARFVGVLAHKAEHSALLQKMLEFDRDYDPSDTRPWEDAVTFLQTWHIHHITQVDRAYLPHMKGLAGGLGLRALLIDFGSVLNHFDTHRFAGRLAAICRRNPEEVHTLIYQRHPLTREYEAGDIDSESFMGRLASLCDYPFHESDIADAYSSASTPLEGAVELVSRLKARYRLGLVADSSRWHFQRIIESSSAFPLFDTVTLSYRVGALRPDPRLWEDALDQLDLLSEECACITDHEAFAAAAEGHLFRSILFTSPDRLEVELRNAGIL